MEKYSVEQFKQDVMEEAKALRERAVPEELGRLSAHLLRPDKPADCIYGQMTGDCTSRRATRLIFECCPRYFENPGRGDSFDKTGFSGVQNYVNGKQIAGVQSSDELYEHRSLVIRHFSAIETYILLPNGKNAELIAYLKGETETLDL